MAQSRGRWLGDQGGTCNPQEAGQGRQGDKGPFLPWPGFSQHPSHHALPGTLHWPPLCLTVQMRHSPGFLTTTLSMQSPMTQPEGAPLGLLGAPPPVPPCGAGPAGAGEEGEGAGAGRGGCSLISMLAPSPARCAPAG